MWVDADHGRNLRGAGWQRADLYGISSDYQAQIGKLTNIPRDWTVTVPILQVHSQSLGATPRLFSRKVVELALIHWWNGTRTRFEVGEGIQVSSRSLDARFLVLVQNRQWETTSE